MSQMPSADAIRRYQRLARSFSTWGGLDELAERHREHVARINANAERLERVGSVLERHSNHG